MWKSRKKKHNPGKVIEIVQTMAKVEIIRVSPKPKEEERGK